MIFPGGPGYRQCVRPAGRPGAREAGIATIPEFVWELSLGIYLMVEGFKPSPILSGTIGDAGADERSPALAAPDR